MYPPSSHTIPTLRLYTIIAKSGNFPGKFWKVTSGSHNDSQNTESVLKVQGSQESCTNGEESVGEQGSRLCSILHQLVTMVNSAYPLQHPASPSLRCTQWDHSGSLWPEHRGGRLPSAACEVQDPLKCVCGICSRQPVCDDVRDMARQQHGSTQGQGSVKS